MPKLTFQSLGRRLIERRKGRGIREAAGEIGISAATLSRVERGYLPDVETFGKICRWLEINPAEVLGMERAQAPSPNVAVHFRKDRALAPKTASALAEMILAAHRAWLVTKREG
jgi:transcriptional regulator with XRE-family HTH domain